MFGKKRDKISQAGHIKSDTVGLIVTNIDNLIRFILQKKLADTHPLITIFGVFIGLPLFGFMGIIFGPLLLSVFLVCVNIFKNQYLR